MTRISKIVLISSAPCSSPRRQSYDVDIEVSVVGTNIRSVNSYDLKNPNFRYMSATAAPPGSHHSCPTESYWDQGHASSQVVAPQPPVAHSVAQAYSHPPGQTIIGANEVISLVNGGMLSPTSHTAAPHSHTAIPHAMHAQNVQGHGTRYTGHGIQTSLQAGVFSPGTPFTGSNQILLGNPAPTNPLVYQKIPQQQSLHSQQAPRVVFHNVTPTQS